MKIDAAFVTSAADANGFPGGGLPELALVGRSNVGKSTLINALLRQRLARTSGAPGKTRLANVFRVTRPSPGSGQQRQFYLVDLPGFGFARGKREELEAVVREYFGRREAHIAALLLIDSRHPGLESDIAAWKWLASAADSAAIVSTKIDKLSRSERQRAMGTNDAVFEHPVLPVSAVTGEGLDELWKLIDQQLSSPRQERHPRISPNPMAAPERLRQPRPSTSRAAAPTRRRRKN
jgi:GTP-binding protein